MLVFSTECEVLEAESPHHHKDKGYVMAESAGVGKWACGLSVPNELRPGGWLDVHHECGGKPVEGPAGMATLKQL